jgi:hypothetical protein
MTIEQWYLERREQQMDDLIEQVFFGLTVINSG